MEAYWVGWWLSCSIHSRTGSWWSPWGKSHCLSGPRACGRWTSAGRRSRSPTGWDQTHRSSCRESRNGRRSQPGKKKQTLRPAVDVKMEILVRVWSPKSKILSLTSFQIDKIFWGVLSTAVEQSRRKANRVAQGDRKFGPEAVPKIPPKQKKSKHYEELAKLCYNYSCRMFQAVKLFPCKTFVHGFKSWWQACFKSTPSLFSFSSLSKIFIYFYRQHFGNLTTFHLYFSKAKLKLMLTFLEMRKAFRAGGERVSKISLSPLQPTDRQDV